MKPLHLYFYTILAKLTSVWQNHKITKKLNWYMQLCTLKTLSSFILPIQYTYTNYHKVCYSLRYYIASCSH